MFEGEQFDVGECLVVAPVAGVFHPAPVRRRVCAGDVVGHLQVSAGEQVAVTSPFSGELVEVVAWPGERLGAYQRVARLRVA